MRRYEVIEYTHEDVKNLTRDMTIENVINILDNLEGRWLPKMPSTYYNEHAVYDEGDYNLIRALVAIRKAIALLKDGDELRKKLSELPTIEAMEYPQVDGITPTLITTKVSEDMDYCNNCPYISYNNDCISRKWLEEYKKVISYTNEWRETEVDEFVSWKNIANAPSVVPSRAEGEWFIREYEYFTCNQCGEDVESYAESTQEAINMLENGEYPNYCPNCGARMKGVDNEKL